MLTTPDLSKEFHPQPKIFKAKKSPKGIGLSKKVLAWEDGRKLLKKEFKENGVTECELIGIKEIICKKDNFLGFAHIRRRNTLTPEQVVDPHFVVLACQPHHEYVDFKLPKPQAEKILDEVVRKRGW